MHTDACIPIGACRLGWWAGRQCCPPHPGPVASQARHQSVSPYETNASRYVVPKGEGEPFGRACTNPSALDCNQGWKTILPLPKGVAGVRGKERSDYTSA